MKSFNLRVYGLLLNENLEILISEEFRFGNAFTKFPGGGLEFGEGLADGLKREFQEELAISVAVGELFYVNDFYQESAYNSNHQLLSFYYFVHFNDWKNISLGKLKLPLCNEGEQQRWVSVDGMSAEMMTFPIDKLVVEKLKNFKITSK